MGTGFAGSLLAVASLTGWGAVVAVLERVDAGQVVVQETKASFMSRDRRLPHVRHAAGRSRACVSDAFRRRGRARVSIVVEVVQAERVAMRAESPLSHNARKNFFLRGVVIVPIAAPVGPIGPVHPPDAGRSSRGGLLSRNSVPRSPTRCTLHRRVRTDLHLQLRRSTPVAAVRRRAVSPLARVQDLHDGARRGAGRAPAVSSATSHRPSCSHRPIH
jgi:hypothetical protein